MSKALRPPAWTEQALCAQTDPEEFFPEKGGTTRYAKRICGGCSVRLQCLQGAINRGERYGIFGGLSERDRRKLADRMAAEGRSQVTEEDLEAA